MEPIYLSAFPFPFVAVLRLTIVSSYVAQRGNPCSFSEKARPTLIARDSKTTGPAARVPNHERMNSEQKQKENANIVVLTGEAQSDGKPVALPTGRECNFLNGDQGGSSGVYAKSWWRLACR
jgi:hypothetical protein